MCKELLRIFVNVGQITSAESLTSLALIPSGPVDFDSFKLQSNFRVSFLLTSSKVKAFCWFCFVLFYSPHKNAEILAELPFVLNSLDDSFVS